MKHFFFVITLSLYASPACTQGIELNQQKVTSIKNAIDHKKLYQTQPTLALKNESNLLPEIIQEDINVTMSEVFCCPCIVSWLCCHRCADCDDLDGSDLENHRNYTEPIPLKAI